MVFACKYTSLTSGVGQSRSFVNHKCREWMYKEDRAPFILIEAAQWVIKSPKVSFLGIKLPRSSASCGP